MAVVLCTGAGATVTAQMDADLFAGIIGNEKIVLAVGRQMEAAIIDNNTVRIYDGSLMCQGRHVCIEANTSEDFYIDTGEQGVTRYDIIGFRLYREDGNELCEQFTRKNVGESEDITEAVFRNGAEEVYISMYKVRLDGLTIAEITPMYSSVLTAMGDINKSVKESMENILKNQIVSLTDAITEDSDFVSIQSQMLKYNKLTGAVHGEVAYSVEKNFVSGSTYTLGYLNIKYAPQINIPVVLCVDSEDAYMTGRIHDKTHSSTPGKIIARAHERPTDNNTFVMTFDYYIEPGIE